MRSVESLASAPEELQCTSSSSAWSAVAQSLCESSVVVSGLRPLGCYVFRVCAYGADSTSHKSIAVVPSTPLAQEQVASVLSAVSEPFQTLRRI